MKRQQITEYQLDLFSAVGEDAVCPCVNSEVVNGALPPKACQVKEAGEQKRAIAHNLMEAILCQSNINQAYKQVNRNKGVDRMSTTGFAKWFCSLCKRLQYQRTQSSGRRESNGVDKQLYREQTQTTCQ